MNLSQDWSHLLAQWWKIALPLGILIATVVAGFAFRKALFSWVRRWSLRTGHHMDVLVIPTLQTPLILWSVILGIDLAARSSDIPVHFVRPFYMGIEILWIVSLTIIVAQLAGNIVRNYTTHSSGVQNTATLTTTLTQILVSVLGLMVLLNRLSVNIVPYLTALGVGGLAVALALQDTLANLFAGSYISISSQIRLGDYVKLNSGEEGYVTDINWRSTTLRALANNYIFVPNAKLAQAIVTNYNLPTKALGMNVSVKVGFDADTDTIERILIEESQGEKIPGLVTEPPPNVSWNPGTLDWAVQLSLNFQVEEFVNQYSVQSELRRRIFRRFRKEGIALPYPIQISVKEPTNALPSAT